MSDLTRRQCTGTNRRGQRCGLAPIPGGPVCTLHGGKAPQVVASAQRRLLAGADLAIDYLLNLLEPKPPCDKCGRSEADRDPVVVKACQLVLDRSGFGPTASLTVSPGPSPSAPDPSAYLTTEELHTISGFFEEALRRMREANAPPVVTDTPAPDAAEFADGVYVDDEP